MTLEAEIHSAFSGVGADIKALYGLVPSNPTVKRYPDAFLFHREQAGYLGGQAVTGSANQRKLNVEVDGENLITLSNNRFTPTQDLYCVAQHVHAFSDARVVYRIYDVTNGQVVGIEGNKSLKSDEPEWLTAEAQLFSGVQYEIQTLTDVAASAGFGTDYGDISGYDVEYGRVAFWKHSEAVSFGVSSVTASVQSPPVPTDPAQIPSVEFVGVNFATQASTVAVPAGAQAGDMAVMIDYSVASDNPGHPSENLPAGWTIVFNPSDAAPTYRTIIAYKVLTAGDLGANLKALGSGSWQTERCVFALRRVNGLSSITGFVASPRSNAAPTDQVIAGSGAPASAAIVGFALSYTNYGGGSDTGVFDNSPAFDQIERGIHTPWSMIGFGIKLKNSNQQDMTVSMGDLGFGNFVGGFIVD